MSHNKLAEMRKRAGLTQQQLAEKIGVTQQTIWYFEISPIRPTRKCQLVFC